jgi:acyl carrier protein
VEIANREVSSNGDRLLSKLASSRVTVMQATPATWRLMLEAGWQRSKDLTILCGGEAMSRELACELLNRSASVWNMYGPTETTIWSTTSRITTADGPITVGKPIANTETYVLDCHLEPVPVGVPGELYIGGDGLARGYLNRPDLTAEKFILNTFREPQSGARLYKTGDLVRYRPNGEIECLGRIDHQVKLRGFRIELGEIEFVLGQHPAVKQNVVAVREDVPGDKRLVAYLALRSGTSIALESLRDFLKQRLPDYMLPSRFIFLEALPLTPNGKVDRRNLPSTNQLECNRSDEPVAPRNDVERQLLKIWRSVLNTDAIGVTDNFFFKHGGHSLLVAKLLRRVEQVFGKRFSMAAMFDAPTIEAQAAMLSDGTALLRPSAVVPVQPVGSKPPFFCVGYHAGPIFLPLAKHLGSDQPLLGIDPTLLQTSELDSPFEMESIAASLIKQIRAIQPHGPYFLGGFCGGGLTAYEVASQLATQGHHVGLLALFEPLTPTLDHEHARPFPLRQKMSFHFHNLRKLGVGGGLAYLTGRAGVLFGRVAKHVSSTLSYVRSHRGWPRDGEAILDHALDVYRPRPFPGHLTLFLATDRPPGHEWECEYWRGLSRSMDIHEIPGYWNLVLRFFVEPSVEILANKLREHLKRDRLRVSTDR